MTLIQPLFSANESDLVELQHANVLGKGSQRTKAALSVWAGRNAGTRQLSKECSFGRNSRAKNEGEKMNSKFRAGLQLRGDKKSWLFNMSCQLHILGPCYSQALLQPWPQPVFWYSTKWCLLLLTAEACAPKCVLSTECKWTWHFQAWLLQTPRFPGIAMQQDRCCSPQLKLKMLHRKTYHVKVRFTWDPEDLVFSCFSLISTVNISCPCCVACQRLHL